MARKFPVKFVRSSSARRSAVVRVSCEQLEDRTTPTPLFAPGANVASFNDTSNFTGGQSADFNGDGKLDFAVGDYTSGKIFVYPGNGNGTFGAPTVVSTNTTDLNYLVAGDMNGDGHMDLVASYANDSGTFRVYLNNGTGGFTPDGSFGSGGSRAVGIAVGDLDGNGSQDIAVVNSGHSSTGAGGGLFLFLNSAGDGSTWTQSAAVPMGVDSNSTDSDGNPVNPYPNLPLAVAIGDMNNDGHQDVVVASATAFVDPVSGVGGQSEGTLFTFFGDGGGSYSGVASQTTGGTATLGLTLGDVNGDGLMDAVVANSGAESQSDLFGHGNFGVLINSGSGFGAAHTFGTGSTPFSVAVGDFNGDGKADFIGLDIAGGTLSSPTNGKMYAFLGNGSGTSFNPADQSPYGIGYAGGQFLIEGDYDANGLPDIVTVGVKPDSLFGMLVSGGGRADFYKNQTTAPAATTTSLAADVNPSSFGQSVTFTATVTATAGAATGTVAFYDNGTQIGTGTLDASSPPLATFTTSALGVATHPITAKFLGGSGFAASAASNTVSQVVNQATSSVTLSANPTSAPVGTNVLFTATVGSPTTTPSGSVKFYEGATLLNTATLAGGTATFNTTALTPGTHTITAQYVGTANILGSTSNSVDVQVGQLTTTVTVSASPSPSSYTQSVTFTAVVSAAGGPPTGTVNFYDGATLLGPGTIATVGGQQVATLTTSTLALGDHTIQAKYTGTANFGASDSPTITQTVNPLATTTAVTVSPLASATATQLVTITATVGPAGGSPTGTVDFYIDNALAGSQPLSGSTAAFTTSTLALGGHTFQAKYGGGTGFTPSDSTTVNYTINAIGTTVTVAALPSPATFGQAVTFTATVAGALGTPAGSVDFYEGTTLLGSGTLATVGGVQQAVYQTSALGLGGHTVTAKFAAQGNFAAGQGTATVTVNPIGTTVTVAGLPSPALATELVTFTAVVGSASGTATGSVDFYEGATKLGTGVLTTDGGQQVATYSTTGLTLGSHTITAKYTGATGYATSQADSASLQVNPIPTTISVGTSPSPSLFTQTVTISAVVGASLGAVPTGPVVFYANNVQIGTGALATVGGQQVATFALANLALGDTQITAKYAANGFLAGVTSTAVTHTVNPAGTTTTVATSGSPTTYGQPVTFTATVAGQAGTPVGLVNFYADGTQIGSGALATVGGQQVATFQTAGLAAGARTVVAKYAGATGYAASDSAALPQTVNPAAATAVLGVSSATPTVGEAVTFTATVSSTAGIPTGSVTFFVDGVAQSTVGLTPGSGQAVAAFQTSGLALGAHTVQAKYPAAGNYAGADTAPQTVTVERVPTVTALTTGGGSSLLNQPVTFTATVSAAAGAVPFGATVTFLDNGAPIGTGQVVTAGGLQVATFTTSALAVGSHPITARFEQTGNFAASMSAAVTQQVSGSSTSVALTSSLPTALFSQPVTFTATVSSPAGTPTGTVTFLDGLTPLGTGTLSTVGGQQVATFTTSSLAVGAHTVTASFAGGGAVPAGASPAVTQTVSTIPSTVAVAADRASATTGQSVTLTATVSVPAGVTVAPTGTVTFRTGATVLGTGALVGGTATVTTAALPTGTDAVTATYDGDAVTAPGTGATTVAVSETPPATLLGSREFGVGAGAGMDGIARFFNPDGTERYSTDVFPGSTGGVRVTSADFNGDGVADLVAGTGPGGPSHVVILDGKTKAVLFTVDPFEASFTGGVYVAAGDVTGDGVPDLFISPDEGGGPRVRVFSGAGFGQVDDFLGIDDPSFRGGARVAVGDLNGDGVGDLIVAAGFSGGPRVAGYSGKTLGTGSRAALFADFFAFEPELRNGAFIAVGDVNGDGKADLIGGGGPGGGPRVTIFSGADLVASNAHTVLSNFFAGDPNNRGGVRLVARNLDGDQYADLVTGDGTDAGSRVTGYSGKTLTSGSPAQAFSFDAFPGFTGGVYVG